MEVSLLSLLALGFVLGIKHAIEPDHIIAVSTVATKSKNLFLSSLTGVFWGVGHTMTLFIVGMFLIFLKGELSETVEMSLEFLVGIMLVYLGLSTMLSHKQQKQQINSSKPSYIKSVFIGFIHGLAGSAAMVMLTMSTVEHPWQGALYISVFGAGTCIGMLLFTALIGIPFVTTKKQMKLNRYLTNAAGVISVLFGFYYMYNLGVNDGLFQLWMQ